MFNLGIPEMLVIAGAALLVFGPKRLPELAKSMGKGIRDFKKALEGGGNDEKKKALSAKEVSGESAPDNTIDVSSSKEPVPESKTSDSKDS